MSWLNQITDVLQNYSQSGQPPAEGEVESHFHQVAQAAPPADLASGLAAMFHSNQTPPFAQMIGQLFSNSNGAQRANLLNTLLSSSAGAGILSQLARAAGVSIPSTLGCSAPITPEVADGIPTEAVQQAAAHAEQDDPSIVERASEFYAQHPTLVKTLGAAAMAIAMSHLANRRP
ncbi:MAG: hypothetical protein ACR2II_06495 [Chthoniobacterales bacterium]